MRVKQKHQNVQNDLHVKFQNFSGGQGTLPLGPPALSASTSRSRNSAPPSFDAPQK